MKNIKADKTSEKSKQRKIPIIVVDKPAIYIP